MLKQSVVLDDEWEQPRREVALGGDDGDVSGADSVEWGDGRFTQVGPAAPEEHLPFGESLGEGGFGVFVPTDEFDLAGVQMLKADRR